MNHKKYCIVVFMLMGGLMGGVALLNYAVDAYGVFGRNTLGIYVLHTEGEVKSAHLAHYGETYDCFLLGDSRCDMIDIEGVDMGRIYNTSLSGGHVEEFYHYIKNNIPDGKKLIWGMWLGQAGTHSENHRLFEKVKWYEKAAKYLFSAKAVEISARTIKKYLRGSKVRIKKNGSIEISKWIEQNSVDNLPLHTVMVKELIESLANKYSFDEANMEYYKRIAELGKEKSLDIYTFIYPVHEEVMAGVVGTAGYKELSKWKESIVRLFPRTVDLSESEYNVKESFLCTDIIHFKSETGVSFLNKEIIPLMR